MNERAGLRPKPHTTVLNSVLHYRRSTVVAYLSLKYCSNHYIEEGACSPRPVQRSGFAVLWLVAVVRGAEPTSTRRRKGGSESISSAIYVWRRDRRKTGSESAETLQLQKSPQQSSGGAGLHSPLQVSHIRVSTRILGVWGFGIWI